MLVLSRHQQESVVINLPDGRRVTVTVIDIRDHSTRVRLGFDAPADVVIHRGEVQQEIDRANGPPAMGGQTPPQSAGNGPSCDSRPPDGPRTLPPARPASQARPGLGGYIPRRQREGR